MPLSSVADVRVNRGENGGVLIVQIPEKRREGDFLKCEVSKGNILEKKHEYFLQTNFIFTIYSQSDQNCIE